MSAKKERLPVSKLDDADMQAAPVAMERAVQLAHWDAYRNGTGVLVVENGEMVEVDPDPALYEAHRARMLKRRRSILAAEPTRRCARGSKP